MVYTIVSPIKPRSQGFLSFLYGEGGEADIKKVRSPGNEVVSYHD